MTQFAAPPQADPSQPPPPTRTSVLAIVSLVSGLLFCIPVLPQALGVILGIAALIAVGRSAGRIKGRGLAIGGIVASTLSIVGWGVASLAFYYTLGIPAQPVERFLVDLQAGDVETARVFLTEETSDAMSDSELVAFGSRLEKEYGRIQNARADIFLRAFRRGIQPPPDWDPSQAYNVNRNQTGIPFPMPIQLECSNGTAYGVAFIEMDQKAGGPPTFRIESIQIADSAGAWGLPPANEDDSEPDS